MEYKVTKDILTFASVTTGFHSPAIGDGGATICTLVGAP